MPPPPPMLHSLPPHSSPHPPMPRIPSANGHRMSTPILPPLTHTPMPRPPIPMPLPPPPMPIPISDFGHHRRVPSEPALGGRRMSGSMYPPPLGPTRSQWGLPSNALRGNNHSTPHAGIDSGLDHSRGSRFLDPRIRIEKLRALREDSLAQLALRAQAERLRRRRLENLDLQARQHNIRAQALRDLRKREFAMKLRERGLQQREIDTQVRLMAEREQLMTEAQLRELRDRDHRLILKEKGLQEREILEQIRRREEKDREVLRNEIQRLDGELRRKELLDAELSIKRALERGDAPPLGVSRPTIDEIENEGLLAEDFFEEFEFLDPRLRQEILAQSGLSPDYQRTRTYGDGLTTGSIGQRTPDVGRGHARTPSVGARTPLMGSTSPGHTNSMRDRIRDEHSRLSEENWIREQVLTSASRSTTPKIRDELLNQMTPRLREEMLENERRGLNVGHGGMGTPRRDEMLGDQLTNQLSTGRPRSQSFDRRSPSLASTTTPRLREDIRAAGLERRTPSIRDGLDPSYDGTGLLDLPLRSVSRASSRGGDYDDVVQPLSRSGSVRDGYSPAERLGLPSRPASRNLTAEDLGLGFESKLRSSSREREPQRHVQYSGAGHAHNDDLLTARLQDAAVNSEINGGRRSRANSRAERPDNDFLLSARTQYTNDPSLGAAPVSSMAGRRSRANSRAELPSDDVLRSASRNQLGIELGSSGGIRSRANSVGQAHHTGSNSQLGMSSLGDDRGYSISGRGNDSREYAAQEDIGRGRDSRPLSRPPSRGPSRGPSRATGASTPYGHTSTHDSGLGGISNEELSQLTTEQLEMLLLSDSGDYPHLLNDSLHSTPLSKEEISQLTAEELDSILAGPPNGGRGGMSSLDISGGGARRNLSRQSSRVGLGDSPPFGGAAQGGYDQARSHSRNDVGQGAYDQPRSHSRNEVGQSGYDQSRSHSRNEAAQSAYDQPRSHSRNDPRIDGQSARYGSSTPNSTGPSPNHQTNNTSSLYSMPGQYDSYGFADDGLGPGRMEYDAGEFVVTEHPEEVGTKVIEQLGMVEADSFQANHSPMANRAAGLNGNNGMHLAVNNLIAEARYVVCLIIFCCCFITIEGCEI